MAGTIANYFAVAFGFAALGYLIWLAAHPDQERLDEDDARAFFDEYGRWPDDPDPTVPAPFARASGTDAAVDPHAAPRRAHD